MRICDPSAFNYRNALIYLYTRGLSYNVNFINTVFPHSIPHPFFQQFWLGKGMGN